MTTVCIVVGLLWCHPTAAASKPDVTFTLHSARTGPWSAEATWEEHRVPGTGDRVQVRAGHLVTYDASSDDVIRVIHVAGTLAFSRDRSTKLTVGLIKVQRGDAITEDGFACDAHAPMVDQEPTGPTPALEIGTPERPIPANVIATIRLAHVDGADPEDCPAIIICGGRWDVHGAPMSRTWLKLAETAAAGSSTVKIGEPADGWRVGDQVILTPSVHNRDRGGSRSDTEQRTISGIDGTTTITLDRPLATTHGAAGDERAEIANLSRNIVIESADPDGIRGHTMYHAGSSGSISYAEFRHLGKQGVLGKYAIHFHLCGDSMRGSGVVGASIWDSANRWITVHGTNHLLVRDCVGYRSIGHGFFLEDASEEYNVFDRNLAVGATRGKPLPKQALPFDPNEGAGFWWANGRNAFVRNVSTDNHEYGFRFQIEKHSNYDPTLAVEQPDGTRARTDVRTLPFLRFEDNESHRDGLYSFNFGDDRNGAVHGDKQHPFIVRNLRSWQNHYALRPNVQFFLCEDFKMEDVVYGVYHPDYDAHVYRNVSLKRVDGEPINRGHDDESIQYGSFTYENLSFEDCRCGRDPLIQLACTSPIEGAAGHFRNVTIRNSRSNAQVVDLGGGPRNDKLQNPVVYYFHDLHELGKATKVVSVKFPAAMSGGNFESIKGFTGKDVRAAEVSGVVFPKLLEPVDDLPPATMIRSVRWEGVKVVVSGVSCDNGEVASVLVNDVAAKLTRSAPGVFDWTVTLDAPADKKLTAKAVDAAGNREIVGHVMIVPVPAECCEE
jgi:hypothetical protein